MITILVLLSARQYVDLDLGSGIIVGTREGWDPRDRLRGDEESNCISGETHFTPYSDNTINFEYYRSVNRGSTRREKNNREREDLYTAIQLEFKFSFWNIWTLQSIFLDNFRLIVPSNSHPPTRDTSYKIVYFLFFSRFTSISSYSLVEVPARREAVVPARTQRMPTRPNPATVPNRERDGQADSRRPSTDEGLTSRTKYVRAYLCNT